MKKKPKKNNQLEKIDIVNDEEGITKEDLEETASAILEEEEDKQTLLPSGLRLHEEEFCKAYISHDRDLYGNGVKCYLEVYGPDYMLKYKKYMSYKAAGVLAFRMLKKVKIINRINELLEVGGFNNENVDKQHLFLLNQHADLKSKLGAIKEYNTLKKRIDISPNVVIINTDKKNSFNKALEFLQTKK